jgi:hypothetical protein
MRTTWRKQNDFEHMRRNEMNIEEKKKERREKKRAAFKFYTVQLTHNIINT